MSAPRPDNPYLGLNLLERGLAFDDLGRPRLAPAPALLPPLGTFYFFDFFDSLIKSRDVKNLMGSNRPSRNVTERNALFF
jgi:hypothetical protein